MRLKIQTVNGPGTYRYILFGYEPNYCGGRFLQLIKEAVSVFTLPERRYFSRLEALRGRKNAEYIRRRATIFLLLSGTIKSFLKANPATKNRCRKHEPTYQA